jgi:hypothetical protein
VIKWVTLPRVCSHISTLPNPVPFIRGRVIFCPVPIIARNSSYDQQQSWVSSLTLVKLANCFEIEVYELFRPEGAPADEAKQAVKSLVNDISVTFEHFLRELSQKYLV